VKDEMGRTFSTNGGEEERMGETRNAYRILVGGPEGKRPQGRRGRRWVDNIKIDLREIGCDGMDWIDLAQDKDQWMLHAPVGDKKNGINNNDISSVT
jgi:hypothetical protein